MTSPTTPEKIEPLTEQELARYRNDFAMDAHRPGGWSDEYVSRLLATITDRDEKLATLRPPAAGEDVRDAIAEIIEPLVDFSAVYGDDLGYSRDAVKRLSARMRATAILSHLQSVGYARVPERADIAQWFDKNVVQPGHNKRERFARSASDYADSLLAALKERG